MPKRPCLDCGKLGAGTRCDPCRLVKQRTRDSQRATPEQRGYGPEHRRLRQRWAPKVKTGLVDCARCHLPIGPCEPWALDHTDDRTGYLGPSHVLCNNEAGGRARHRPVESGK